MKQKRSHLATNLIVGIIFSSLLFSCQTKEVSVMTWNIWHGGLHGSKESGFEKDTVNTFNVTKVLMQENPDVLFMQETYCCGMERAKEAGYPYSVRGSSNLSIHSKFPIVDTIKLFRPFYSHAAIINVNGDSILCVNVWLNWRPDYFVGAKTLQADSLIAGEYVYRMKELKAILQDIDSIDNKYQLPIIVGGDFNSASHLDWTEQTKENHYNLTVDWPVSKLMQENGFIDSYRKCHPDPVQNPAGTWGWHDGDFMNDRIDYLYYKGNRLQAIASKVVKEDPTGGIFNSDHRGMSTSFQIK